MLFSVTKEAQNKAGEGKLDLHDNRTSGEKNKLSVYLILSTFAMIIELATGEFVHEQVKYYCYLVSLIGQLPTGLSQVYSMNCVLIVYHVIKLGPLLTIFITLIIYLL